MKKLKSKTLEKAVIDVLKYTPYEPFLCLPLSTLLYVLLKDKYQFDAKLVTGDLKFKTDYIFKQDFKISEAKDGVLTEWSGHSWVEIDNLICDLSIFRTLYSDQFTKPCKAELIANFGEGRGCLIFEKDKIQPGQLSYIAIDYLPDEMAIGILKGFRDYHPALAVS